MKFNIRLKLIAFAFCLVLLVGGSISVYSIYVGRERIFTTFAKDAREITSVISGTIANELYFLDLRSLRRRLESARVNPNISYTYVTDQEGVVLADGTGENALRDQKLTDSFSREMLRSDKWISRFEESLLKVGGPVHTADGSRIGYFQVGFSLDAAYGLIRDTTRTALYITVICLGFGAILAVIFSTSFSRPILDIVQASREIGGGKLDTRLPVRRADELGALAGSVNQMAEALQRRQAETERGTHEQAALNAIAMATSQSLQIDAVLQIALDKILEVMGRDVGFIRLKDDLTGRLTLVAHRGLSESYVASLEKEGRVGWMAAKVLATGELLTINDPSPGDLLEESWREGIRATIWVPIQTHGQVVGVLTVASRTARPFETQDVGLLKAISNIVGTAVANARLYEETRQRAEKLEALNELAHLITSSLSTQKVFDFVVRSAAKFVNAKMVRLWAEDQTSGSFVVRASCGIEQPLLQQHTLVPTLRAGEGVIGRIIENKTAEYLLDVREEPRWLNKQMARSLGLISFAGVPIVMGDRVLGVLTIMTDHLHEFSEEEKGLMKGFADQAAVAIENARLFEETKRHLERVRALREIDQAITSTLDLRTVLDVLMEKIDLVLPYSATTVRLLNKESGAIEPVACRNLDEKEWKAERWRGGRGIPNVVFETKAPVTISNVQSDPQNRDQEFFRKHGLVSYLGVPLIAKGEILGVISFYTKEEHEFSNEEVELLTALAGQAAIAIHNSRLYEETERRRREAEEMARVAQSLTESLDMTAVGERIVTSVRELFGVKASMLRLLQPDGSLRTLASAGEGFSISSGGDALPSGTGLTGLAVAEGRPIWSVDVLNEPKIRLTDQMRDHQLRSGNRSMIAVPLRAHKKIIGSLGLADWTGRIYSDSEVALAQTFADQAALALENARLYEEMVKLAADLSRSNKVKDEFLSVMSHELRTPLNVVMGYTGMIRDGLLGEINPEQEKALEKVISRTRDQLTMISSILQATQLEAEGVRVEKTEVKLKDFLDDLRSGYAIPLGKELSVIWDCPPDLPVVHTDAEKLKHVLQNLINNAIKFTEKGHVTVSARYLNGTRIDERSRQQEKSDGQNGAVELKVSDTGVGIAEEHFSLIFERFHQVDSSETRRFGGVGIGLYVVKKFTELLGGEVAVESQPGKGSTFTVTIPVAIHQ